MPGGWTMSMAWMRMPGQSWSGAAVSFLVMWIVMTAAMMLPSLIPMLERYRAAVTGGGAAHPGSLTARVGVGYFMVWTFVGLATFPIGAALASLTMRSPAIAGTVPLATGLVVLIGGALQFSAWKARHLACCRQASDGSLVLSRDAGTAWRYGVRLGAHCVCSCASLTMILLVIGVMDLRAMAAVTAAITIERLAPSGDRVARAIGAAVAGLASVILAQAAGL